MKQIDTTVKKFQSALSKFKLFKTHLTVWANEEPYGTLNDIFNKLDGSEGVYWQLSNIADEVIQIHVSADLTANGAKIYKKVADVEIFEDLFTDTEKAQMKNALIEANRIIPIQINNVPLATAFKIQNIFK